MMKGRWHKQVAGGEEGPMSHDESRTVTRENSDSEGKEQKVKKKVYF